VKRDKPGRSNVPALVAVKDEDVSDDAVAIRQIAGYCRSRAAGIEAAIAWISIGQQLAPLRERLKKTSRGDNEKIGWEQAFEQMQPNGKKEFPFSYRRANDYITVAQFMAEQAVPPKIQRHLPASFKGLLTIIERKFTREQIEAAIDGGAINPSSESDDINKLANELGLPKKKPSGKRRSPKEERPAFKLDAKAPKRERLAAIFEEMCRLKITLEDLQAEFGEAR
jgi:hypothetical protein